MGGRGKEQVCHARGNFAGEDFDLKAAQSIRRSHDCTFKTHLVL
jgi:hypothetical protein